MIDVELPWLKSQSLRRREGRGKETKLSVSMLKWDDFAYNTLLMGPLLMVVCDRGTVPKCCSAVCITDPSLEAASSCRLQLKP